MRGGAGALWWAWRHRWAVGGGTGGGRGGHSHATGRCRRQVKMESLQKAPTSKVDTFMKYLSVLSDSTLVSFGAKTCTIATPSHSMQRAADVCGLQLTAAPPRIPDPARCIRVTGCPRTLPRAVAGWCRASLTFPSSPVSPCLILSAPSVTMKVFKDVFTGMLSGSASVVGPRWRGTFCRTRCAAAVAGPPLMVAL